MIDWNENAKAAVREFADYIGQSNKCYRYFNHVVKNQTKTVADAVEHYKGVWPKHVNGCTHMKWDGEHGMYLFSCARDDYRHVCTRAEFESYAKEQEAKQEAEKWTHEYHGDNCKIAHQEKWQAWIVSENGLSKLVPISELRKPKPTMSESEAWRYCVEEDVSPGYVMSLYDVVKD